GKNTSAGVINIISEAPSFTPGFEAEATYGNFGAWGIAGSVTGPLSDKVAGRLYMAKRERDGFYDVVTGAGPRQETDDQNQNFWTARGQLLILPSDDISIRLIADYSKRDEYCCVSTQVRTGPTVAFINAVGGQQAAPAPGFGELPFSRTAYANRGTGQTMEDMGFSAEANIDIPSWNATFTSLSSWRNWSGVNGMDLDYTTADLLYRPHDGGYGFELDNLTQEVRLAGATDRIDWLVGAFMTRETINRDDSYWYGAGYTPFMSLLISSQLNAGSSAIPISPNIVGCLTRPGTTAQFLTGCLATGGMAPSGPTAPTGPGFGAGHGVQDHYRQTTESFAIFTNNTLHLTDKFDVTLGLRYTLDDKSLSGVQDNLGTNGAACGGALGNIAAMTGALMGAGLPQATAQATAGRLASNLCLPWANPMFDNRRIGEGHSNGEFSGTVKGSYRFNDSVMAYASYARGYKSFGYNMDRVQGPTAANPLPINPGNFPQLSLLPGARASFAPEWSATAAVAFDRSIGSGMKVGLNLSAKYSTEFNTGSDLLPYKMQDAMTLLNGRITLGAEDDRWALDLWAQNLTDEEYKQVAINAPLQGSAFQTTVQPNGTYYNPALDTQTYNAFMGQPRTYGVTLRVRY
ncbi:TonB-dependent receptor domain-containing protein, partial [Brevundimonas naejangsanensis]